MSNLVRFNENVYQLIEKLMTTDAKSITISTKEATIVFELKNGSVTGSIYKQGSLDQVWMHSQNSVRELIAAFESLGVCMYNLIKQLVTGLLWKRNKPLLLELKPSTK